MFSLTPPDLIVLRGPLAANLGRICLGHLVTGLGSEGEAGVDDSALGGDRRAAHVQRARAVDGDVAGSGRERQPRQVQPLDPELDDVGPVRAGHHAELAVLPLGAGDRDAHDQAAQPRLWPPSEQSLCQLTSEAPSTTPTFLSNPSAASAVSKIALLPAVTGEAADGGEAVRAQHLAERG